MANERAEISINNQSGCALKLSYQYQNEMCTWNPPATINANTTGQIRACLISGAFNSGLLDHGYAEYELICPNNTTYQKLVVEAKNISATNDKSSSTSFVVTGYLISNAKNVTSIPDMTIPRIIGYVQNSTVINIKLNAAIPPSSE